MPIVRGVVSVIELPSGYVPAADHMVLLRTQPAPYRWASIALLELDGKVVGLIEGEEQCGPDKLQPPETFLVPPPVQGLTSLDPARRSGVGMIDAVLDVLQRGNEDRIIDLLTYRALPCAGAGPTCPQGAPAGSLVEAVPNRVCTDGFESRDQILSTLSREWSQYALYAVTSLKDGRDGVLVVLASPDGPFALELVEGKIVATNSGCGPGYPDTMFDGPTNYLLLPL
jgi:hypothetical protein